MPSQPPITTSTRAPEQRGPRLELKMRLSMDHAEAFQDWLTPHLPSDPHAPDPNDPVQQITTLYFDDVERSGYIGRLPDKSPRHRMRRYGDCPELFLEEKLRLGDQVWKRRLPLSKIEAEQVAHGLARLDGSLEWFRARFRVLDLVPTLLVDYARHAYEGACGTRVTFDRSIHAARVAPRFLGLTADETPVLSVEDVVVELKGPLERTAFMKEALQWLGDSRTTYSKYNRGLEAVGLETPRTPELP